MSESPRSTASAEDAAGRLGRLWRQGQRPDLGAFLAQAGPLAPNQLAAALRLDQRLRWQSGERVPAEDYLRRHPALAGEAALEVVYGEYLLREELGEAPDPAEYQRRFPEHADRLRQQLEVCRALDDATSTPRDSRQPTPPAAAGGPEPAAARVLPAVAGYEVLGELGRGGMGVVYKARQVALNRTVGLKMILAGAYAGEEELTRFRAEAEAVARFQHPNIAQVYEVGEHDGRPYFSLEFVDGGNLAQA